jgi:outer membrane protein assembly factor BamB
MIAIEGDYIVIKHSGYGKGEVISCFNFENDRLAWEFRQFDIGDFCCLKNGNAYFTNFGKVTCLNLFSGQAKWSKKIFDFEQYHWRIDEFGNFYCIGNTKVVSENNVNPKSLICLDGQTGEVAYSYPLKEKPLYFSVSGGLVLLYNQSIISCLKDLNYGREKPGSKEPPNPILIAGLTLSLLLLAICIRLVIKKKAKQAIHTLYK